MKFADAFIIRKFLAAKSCHNKEANSNTFKYDWQKFNIPFGYHLLTISLTIGKQRIILVKEIVTI